MLVKRLIQSGRRLNVRCVERDVAAFRYKENSKLATPARLRRSLAQIEKIDPRPTGRFAAIADIVNSPQDPTDLFRRE